MTMLKEAAAKVSTMYGLPDDALYKRAVAEATLARVTEILSEQAAIQMSKKAAYNLHKEAISAKGTALAIRDTFKNLFSRTGPIAAARTPAMIEAEQKAAMKFLFPYMAAVGGVGAYTVAANGMEPVLPMVDKNDRMDAIMSVLAGGSAGALATNVAANVSGEEINPRTVALATLLGGGLGFGANALYKGDQ